MNYTLSVGYNGDFKNLKTILETSPKVKNVYTGGVEKTISGGRYQYASDLKSIASHIEFTHKHGATFSLTLNSPCGFKVKSDTKWWDDIKIYLKKIEEIGVDYVIISHPFAMELTKSHTNLKVIASTISEIINTRSALYYESFGADIIVPSTSINMKINELRTMKRSLKHATIKLLVNEVCLGNCPWRRFHQNTLAHSKKKDDDIDYAMSCTNMYMKNPHFILTNDAIRPEDLKHYLEVSNEFKLIGRTTNLADLVTMIKGYSKGKYEGNFVELLDKRFSESINLPSHLLEGLIQKKWECDKNCWNCDYCSNLYEEIKNKTASPA